MMRIGRRLIALSFVSALALGYTQSAHAAAVNVQVINVCDDNGQNCALSSPYANTGYNPAATQRIFAQAGITVNFLDPIKFNSTAYLNPPILDDPLHGYLFGSPTDPASAHEPAEPWPEPGPERAGPVAGQHATA